MPQHLTQDQSDFVKAHLSLAQDRLAEVARAASILTNRRGLQQVAAATYELCSGCGLPAVKHPGSESGITALGDASANIETVIGFDLTRLSISGDLAEVERSAVAIEEAVRALSLS